MTPYQILDETPDVKMKISAPTLEELFSSALLGLASYIKSDIVQMKKADLKERHKIKVEAVDLSSLLVEFLSTAIEHADVNNAVYSLILFEKLGENFLEGKIFGTKVDSLEREVRAVSYDEVEITKNPASGLYETILVFEV